MQQWLQKILLCIAVAIIAGHSILPHYHHEQIENVVHHNHHEDEQGTETRAHGHDENKDEEHSLFSFAQLDEDYVPGKFQNISIDVPIVYLLTPFIIYNSNLIREKAKTHFCYYKEYPPPGVYLSQLPSRGPPPLSNMA